MAYEYWCAFFSYERYLQDLSDAQYARIIRAAFAYAARKEKPDFSDDPLLRMIWRVFQDHIDVGRERHASYTERAKKGGYVKNYGFDPREAMCKDNVNSLSMPKHAIACHKDKEKEKDININKNKEKDTKDFKKSSENGTPSGAEPSEPVQHGAEMIAAWLAQYGRRNTFMKQEEPNHGKQEPNPQTANAPVSPRV